ncbi:histidine phosphatase family protein [Nostocoides sp. HKS02]|uniref:histidine phosphatase family protein n=1 Tax=Nostocoides sp. HKS02 TaxID=1813880 RepID=UPI0012B4B342|nr:histidine phosphatase family protein [Tetrasphaera sp. HKS02]QGN58328.1 histidine phosphatase family protein [Tetrasphaera sp. HKS02]
MKTPTRTVVHLLRHGEVHNPEGVLYGQLVGFHLSDLGHEMARVVANHLADHDVTQVVASSLQRAQETATPVAEAHGIPITTDDRVIEAANVFEGVRVAGMTPRAFVHPRHWSKLTNPLRPSWGEPYAEIAQRMAAAIDDVRAAARGHEAVIVSHQLPIWTVRNALMGKRLWHDPRKRECRLASLTTLTYLGDDLTSVTYSEPAAGLLAQSVGGTR